MLRSSFYQWTYTLEKRGGGIKERERDFGRRFWVRENCKRWEIFSASAHRERERKREESILKWRGQYGICQGVVASAKTVWSTGHCLGLHCSALSLQHWAQSNTELVNIYWMNEETKRRREEICGLSRQERTMPAERWGYTEAVWSWFFWLL